MDKDAEKEERALNMNLESPANSATTPKVNVRASTQVLE